MIGKQTKPKPNPKRRIYNPKQDLALGKPTFILKRGVIGWGLPTFVIYLLIFTGMLVLAGRSVAEALRELIPYNGAIALVAFALAGAVVGTFRWKSLKEEVNKKYKKHKGGKKK